MPSDQADKLANILHRQYWFHHEMTPEEGAQKLHTDDASPPKSVLLIVHGLRKICINQSEVLARSWLVTCHQYGVSAFVWQGNLEGDCPITTLFLKFKVSQVFLQWDQ